MNDGIIVDDFNQKPQDCLLVQQQFQSSTVSMGMKIEDDVIYDGKITVGGAKAIEQKTEKEVENEAKTNLNTKYETNKETARNADKKVEKGLKKSLSKMFIKNILLLIVFFLYSSKANQSLVALTLPNSIQTKTVVMQ